MESSVITLLAWVHIIVCVLLVIIVLFQQGKGSDIGAGLSGGSNQSVFGAQGAATMRSKITVGAAITFMCTSLFLAYVSSRDSSRSILKDEGKPSVVASPTTETSVTPGAEASQTPVETPASADQGK